MKSLFLFLPVSALLLLSCGGKEKTAPETVQSYSAPEAAQTKEVSGDKNLAGYALINASDCLSCHKDAGKLVGPSYQDIAAKYSVAEREKLADAIINGSTGKWGEVPMVAHPNLQKEDVLKMVDYILSVK